MARTRRTRSVSSHPPHTHAVTNSALRPSELECIADNTSRSFRFMNLPAELRLMVYVYLFGGLCPMIPIERNQKNTYRHKLCTKHSRSLQGRTVGDKVRNMGILTANKQLLQESAPVFYNSIFEFNDHLTLNNFIEAIGSMRVYVKYIMLACGVEWSKRSVRSRKLDLHRLPGLRVLDIRQRRSIRHGVHMNFENVVTNVAPALRKLREMRVRQGESLGGNVSDVVRLSFGGCMACRARYWREVFFRPRLGRVRFDGKCRSLRVEYHELTTQIRGMIEAAITGDNVIY